MRRKKSRLITLYPIEKSPDETRNARIRQLEQAVEFGLKAETILEFADKTFEDAENYVLLKLLDTSTDLQQAQADYRAAYAFYQKVKNSVVEGRIAQKTLKELKENNE